MLRASVVLGSLAIVACAPASSPDAGLDAAAADASDAAPCTALPGDLPGERTLGGLLPPLRFVTGEGEVALVDFHTPCAPTPELLLVRVMAAWSSRSAWHAAHTARLEHPRVTVVDLLAEGPDAEPARLSDLDAWRAGYDVPPEALAIDPAHTFAPLAFGGLALPLVLVVDRRDLRVRRALFAPQAGAIEAQVAFELSRIDGTPLPPPFDPPLVRGRFTEDTWDLLEEAALSAPPISPIDPSSAVSGDARAASLGAALFADTDLSPAGIACARCHVPGPLAFTDGLPLGRGVAEVRRNTPTLVGAAFTRWPFWDGRADSLWAQALGPIEAAAEMGSSRLFVAHRVAAAHRGEYEAIFGALPDLSGLPPSGAPGDATYDAMAPADREAVTRVFTNVGKAIAAHERSMLPAPSAFDRYVLGDDSALSTLELSGLEMFADFGCLQCHHGPLLSDDAFHAIDMPGSGTGAEADRGRAGAEDALRSTPFRRTGSYSDDPSAVDPLPSAFSPRMLGAFRTPTLRALRATAPYGHAGTFPTIREVVEHYANLGIAGTEPDPRVVGVLDRHVGLFDALPERIDALTAFLETF